MSRLLRAFRSRAAVGEVDGGMSTAEYCIGLVAACGFAGLLYKLLTGNWVDGLLKQVVEHIFKIVGI